MMDLEVRSAFSVRPKVHTDCSGEVVTKQSFRDEVDTTNIVRRFTEKGILPQGRGPGMYGDFTGVEDYHSTLNRLLAADEAFMSLPADIRSKFDNDPGKLLEFINNDENYDAAVKLGLLDKEKIVKRLESKVKPADKPPVAKDAAEGKGNA